MLLRKITLMLHWFYELGFNVGVPVLVKCEKGKLIIMANTAMVQLKESEKAFMEEETKKLQQKFQKKKKALRARFVAERQAVYAGEAVDANV